MVSLKNGSRREANRDARNPARGAGHDHRWPDRFNFDVTMPTDYPDPIPTDPFEMYHQWPDRALAYGAYDHTRRSRGIMCSQN